MNRHLKFSWGHIIAFVALIAVSYCSFVGLTYLTNGNFTYALIGMGAIDIFFMIFFIGAQTMKASGAHFRRTVFWERVFLFGSPAVFVAGMVCMSHFWTVRSQDEQIVATFTESINGARQLFTDYDEYADARIRTYSRTLDGIIANREADPHTFIKAGFSNEGYRWQKENMVKTLKLRLKSQNYDTLKIVADKWIDGASQGASTWNVFIIGNTREIKNAIGNWEEELKSFSNGTLSNEALTADVPEFTSDGARNAIAGIDSLTAAFTTMRYPTAAAILFGVVIYLMLLFPYFIQNRHTKNIYRLVGDESNLRRGETMRKISRMSRRKSSQNDVDDASWDASLRYLEEDKDYPAF